MAKARRLDRAQVVAAAADIADAQGLEGLTLAAVAQSLSIRIPSLYNHIEGLAALRREIGLLGLRDMDARLARVAAGRQGAAALQAIAGAYFDYAREHPGRYLAAQRPAPETDSELVAAGARVIDLVRDVLKPFGLGARDEIHAVRGFRSLIHGFVSLNAAGGFGLPLEVSTSLRRNLDWYIVGLENVGPNRRGKAK